MRSVSDQLAAVLGAVGPLPPLEVVLHDAAGCVLAEDVRAGADLPQADLAALDGYAVRASDVVTAAPDGDLTLRVSDDVRAGAPDAPTLVVGAAARIASGAPMPGGADAVVPLARTDAGDARVRIRAAVRAGDGVRARAVDVRSGEIALARGTRVGAAQIALLAALGRPRARVHPKPRVVVVSVGDELVEPGKPVHVGQAYDANGHALASAVHDAGGTTFRAGAVPDDHSRLRELLEDQLVRADLVITTGGLSYGAGDTVRDVLAGVGTVRFDALAMWPTRQMGLGEIGDGVPILALPGDPVAALVAFEVFVRPALLAMAGYADVHRPTIRARTTSELASHSGFREFVRGRLVGSPAHGYTFSPVGSPDALQLSAFARANALAVVGEEDDSVAAGTELPCLVLED
ncbi:molybdenum cofactor synthesis domain protein [Beutenbergia cavernae DSM 12333]|uniref:Molybdopterin molybdenumtransferase n=1 Tax=Beutenbergia cavernae (strain ATCC BAA-8 / DSM 12333 / CCUG 43141 / JCM 11478 / NBRC 16432 / NCIMB 13614 / HKI 0122) TaxID=471853 RepID=C5BZJ4_BEUC1|nr:gephyrin-like molybdotransferase Glp [Beutenbergia cavernae]ACQ79166.1 molybdenum cofactor synthesis domain protein [Beutenbergia cavernae DSM 12333]